MTGDLAPHGPQRHRVDERRPSLMQLIGEVAADCGWRRIPTPDWRPTWRREWIDAAGVEWRQHLEVNPERDLPGWPARVTVTRWCDTEDPTHEFFWDERTPLDVHDKAVVTLRSIP